MSCPNSQNPLVLNVSAGKLPEGFCPQNLQELFDAFVARLIISPSTASLNIAGGSTEPQGNVGPWFKNCEKLFVFDDDTGKYVAYAKGGFDAMQPKVADGTFIVPQDTFKLMIEGWGGGGGGCNNGAVSGGGSAGAWAMIIKTVTPGQVIPYSIGLGGAGGSPGASGGATTILGMSIGGGAGGLASGDPVNGGSATGADYSIAGGRSYRSSSQPGPGGDAPRGGSGGRLHGSDATFNVGIVPGGAGGGSTGAIAGGAGANGAILIWY